MVTILESALFVGRLLHQLRVFLLLEQFIPQLEEVFMVTGVVSRVLKEVLSDNTQLTRQIKCKVVIVNIIT